ncbi:MAG: dihydroneopterin aldolase [Nitrospirota bacterium]|nr:dihydroneopterin aldolase [Nitrospirota bacterium]
MPTDRLTIHNIAFTAPCGVFSEERESGMRYRADLTLMMDTSTAAASDRLEDAVDYAAVAKAVVETATGAERFLVERMAADIADVVLTRFAPVMEVDLAVTKVAPPVPEIGGGVTVSIRRARSR